MSYAIGYIVYGINLNSIIFEPYIEDIELLQENDYATSQFSSKGKDPCYIGIDLDDISEGSDINFSELITEPSLEDKANYENIIESILQVDEVCIEFIEILKQTVPTVFVTWGSS